MEQTQTVKTQPTVKLAYEAPKAAFVPMQVEERLLTCGKAEPSGSCFVSPMS